MSIAVPSRLHVQTVDFQVSFFNKGTAEVLSRSVSPNSWKAAAFRAEQEGRAQAAAEIALLRMSMGEAGIGVLMLMVLSTKWALQNRFPSLYNSRACTGPYGGPCIARSLTAAREEPSLSVNVYVRTSCWWPLHWEIAYGSKRGTELVGALVRVKVSVADDRVSVAKQA
eukprot:s621_g37.t3